MKSRSFFFRVFLLIFFASLDVQGDSTKPTLRISHYLQSKYLGNPVTYYDARVRNGRSVNTGIVANVILRKDNYYFILENGTWLQPVFLVDTMIKFGVETRRVVKNNKDLKVQALQSEEFVNSAIAKVGSDTVDTSYTPLESVAQMNKLLPPSTTNNFTGSEEIIYTDLRTKKQMKGKVFVSLEGMVLEDGSLISIEFVGGTVGS